MDTPTLTPFKITTDGIHGSIQVDGQDITKDTAGIELACGFGEASKLIVHRVPHTGTVEGSAIVSLAGSVDAAAAVRALDPAEIRDRCLNDLNSDMSTDPYNQARDVIAQMLSEQT